MIKGLFDSKQYQEKALLRMQVRQKEEWLLSALKQIDELQDSIRIQARTTCLWLAQAYFKLIGMKALHLSDFEKALKMFSLIQHQLLKGPSGINQRHYLAELLLSRRAKKRYKFSHKYQYLQAMLYQQMAIQLAGKNQEDTCDKKDENACLMHVEELFEKEDWQSYVQETLSKEPLRRLFTLYESLERCLNLKKTEYSSACRQTLLTDTLVSNCGYLFQYLKAAFEQHGFIVVFSFEELLDRELKVDLNQGVFLSNQKTLDSLFEKLSD